METSEKTKVFNFFEYHSRISHQNIILSYKGPLTDVLLSEFSKDIRQKLQDDPHAGKKVFSIFMELAQNVYYYSKEENYFSNTRNKVGTLVILQEADCYRIMTGNLVFKSAVQLLQEKCEIINSLDREALREYKRKLRSDPSGEESKGAGIGMVQAALTSSEPLQVEITELDNEYAFYVLAVEIKK